MSSLEYRHCVVSLRGTFCHIKARFPAIQRHIWRALFPLVSAIICFRERLRTPLSHIVETIVISSGNCLLIFNARQFLCPHVYSLDPNSIHTPYNLFWFIGRQVCSCGCNVIWEGSFELCVTKIFVQSLPPIFPSYFWKYFCHISENIDMERRAVILLLLLCWS